MFEVRRHVAAFKARTCPAHSEVTRNAVAASTAIYPRKTAHRAVATVASVSLIRQLHSAEDSRRARWSRPSCLRGAEITRGLPFDPSRTFLFDFAARQQPTILFLTRLLRRSA